MTATEDKLADIDRQIVEAVVEHEDLIRRITDLPPRSPEKSEALRHRDALNEVLVTLHRYRNALDALRRS